MVLIHTNRRDIFNILFNCQIKWREAAVKPKPLTFSGVALQTQLIARIVQLIQSMAYQHRYGRLPLIAA